MTLRHHIWSTFAWGQILTPPPSLPLGDQKTMFWRSNLHPRRSTPFDLTNRNRLFRFEQREFLPWLFPWQVKQLVPHSKWSSKNWALCSEQRKCWAAQNLPHHPSKTSQVAGGPVVMETDRPPEVKGECGILRRSECAIAFYFISDQILVSDGQVKSTG